MILEKPSTQLWIGNHELLVQKVHNLMVEVFGEEHQELVRTRQFYGVEWYTPSKNQYTKADLEPLFYKTSFALGDGERCYIILESADNLSVTCANSLLKLLEEPPYGYHFILLAARRDGVLPTIQSRSVITEFNENGHDHDFIMFLAFFKNPVPGMHQQILQELEKSKITEQQTRLALDMLYHYWFGQHKQALLQADVSKARKADRMLRICSHVSEMPPMPGGLKLFWKNIYLLMTL